MKIGQKQKAEEDLKVIIGRALQKEPKEIDLDYEGENGLMELIKRERAIELSFEGHQFFDILRYKDDLIRGSSTTSEVRFLPYPNDVFVRSEEHTSELQSRGHLVCRLP